MQAEAGQPKSGVLAQSPESIGMEDGRAIEHLQKRITKQLQDKVYDDLHQEAFHIRKNGELPTELTTLGLWDVAGAEFEPDVESVQVRFALVALQFTTHVTAQQVVTGRPGYCKATLVCNHDLVSIARTYLALPDLQVLDVLRDGIHKVDDGRDIDPYGCGLASSTIARRHGINSVGMMREPSSRYLHWRGNTGTGCERSRSTFSRD